MIILPQRQTALVAKQAAEVDLLTGGKVRLGVGIGWNRVEYEALGQDFSTRGRRVEEQITLLRRLWTEQTVTFSGPYDRITGAGLAPMPVQRPIPVWFGAQSPAPTAGPGGLPTAGSRRCPRARSSTRPAGRGGGSREAAATRRPSAWRAACAGSGPGQAGGGDAAMAGRRRHAPVGQHHGRRPQDRR